MPVPTCVFCAIIHQNLPSTVIAQNETLIVIKDIAPKAPVHYLIISKKHIPCLSDMPVEDMPLAQDFFIMAQHLAQNLSGQPAFRLVINNGTQAGQQVFHLHCHFLSGKKMVGGDE